MQRLLSVAPALSRFGVVHTAVTHLSRVPHGLAMARPAHEEVDPVNVYLLGAEAIVHVQNGMRSRKSSRIRVDCSTEVLALVGFL